MKDNKTPGEDSMLAEMLKNADTGIVKKLHRLYECIWETENIPEEWEMAIIHPVHKNEIKVTPMTTKESQ